MLAIFAVGVIGVVVTPIGPAAERTFVDKMLARSVAQRKGLRVGVVYYDGVAAASGCVSAGE